LWILPGIFLAASQAQVAVDLTGRVTDENNAPVARALLSLRSETTGDEPVRLETVSDANGTFRLQLPAPGEYVVSAEREGYFRLEDRPVRFEGGSNELSLVLNHLREVFESVEVTASPPMLDHDRTTAGETLTGVEILSVPYPTTHNLRNALRVMPGVVQDTRGRIHVNGGSEEQTVYLLDGFNVSDPLTGRFESRLSVEAVRSVEILTSNPSAEYGKGSAGALILKTPTGDDKLRYSGTNFVPGIEQHKGLIIGNWTPRFNLSGPLRRGRAWFSDSMDIQYDQHVVEELPKGQDRTSSWRLSNLLRNQINLSPSDILYTGFLINYWNAPRRGLSVLDPMETTVDRRSRQWFFHFKDQIYFGRGVLLEAGYAANRTFGREVPQGGGLYIFTPEGKQGNYFVDAVRKARRDQWLVNLFMPSFELAGGHQLKLGLDLDRLNYWQDVRRTGYVYHRADGSLLRRVVFGGSGLLQHSNKEASFYVQDSWKLRPKLLFELGVRLDWDAIVRNASGSPRFGFSWAPGGLEHTKISGGYAVIHDATNLRLFTRPVDQHALTTYFSRDGSVQRGPAVSFFSIENTNLKRPRYHNWSLGVEQRLPGNFYARAGYLRRRGRDGFTYANAVESGRLPRPGKIAQLGASAVDAFYILGNQRRDVYDALELAVRRVFERQYGWSASYTRSRAFSNAVVDVNVDDPVIVTHNIGRMPWDSPNRLKSWGYLPTFRKKWSVAYLLEYRTGFPFSIQNEEGAMVGEINSFRFPAYFELNLHLERRFEFRGHRWAWRGGFNNITNHKNPNVVNNNTGSPNFMSFYGGSGRVLTFRIRWLGRRESRLGGHTRGLPMVQREQSRSRSGDRLRLRRAAPHLHQQLRKT
jgi:outer membrane receptor protein involved in Fe transport